MCVYTCIHILKSIYTLIYIIHTYRERKQMWQNANISESRWVFLVLLLQLFYIFEMFLNKNFRGKSKKYRCLGPNTKYSNWSLVWGAACTSKFKSSLGDSNTQPRLSDRQIRCPKINGTSPRPCYTGPAFSFFSQKGEKSHLSILP